MKNYAKIFLMSGLILSCVAKPDIPFEPKADIVPRPVSYEALRGVHQLTDSGICADEGLEGIAEFISSDLSGILGKELKIEQTICSGTIMLRVCESFNDIGDEGYKLNVTRKFIEIIAKDEKGIFYGYQTLKQMMPADVYRKGFTAGEEGISIPCGKISDTPKFGWRGMHLDVSRHFVPVENVKRFIDMLAIHKMNVFHWHLTDGPGWRIEIKKYPELTSKGAFRTDHTKEAWDYQSLQIKGTEEATEPYYGGFYTQEDIKDVVKYASDRKITIVPEIEMPGHSYAALTVLPELACPNYDFKNRWHDAFCAGNDDVYTFFEDVLTEVIELFPSEYIHIGGDEVNKTYWKECEKCQAKIASEGLGSEEELQSYFIQRIEKFLISKERKLVGWDEIIEGGLSKSATVMAWRGESEGKKAVDLGNNVVMAPTDFTYLDYYQGRNKFEPTAIGNFINLQKAYSWNPIPLGVSGKAEKQVLGGQAQLWTEFLIDPVQIEYMAFPRACAIAERLWSAPIKNKGYPFGEFKRRMRSHYYRLSAYDINYRFQSGFDKIYEIGKKDFKGGNEYSLRLKIVKGLIRNKRLQFYIAKDYGNNAMIEITNVKLEDADGNVIKAIDYDSRTGNEYSQLNFYTFNNLSNDKDVYFTADVKKIKDGKSEFEVAVKYF